MLNVSNMSRKRILKIRVQLTKLGNQTNEVRKKIYITIMYKRKN